MDTIQTPSLEEILGTDYLDDIPILSIDMTPEDEAMAWGLVEKAKIVMAERAQLRASRRKKEDPETSQSQKISIRLPKYLLRLLKERAAAIGLPYQSFIKVWLHQAVTGESALTAKV